MGDSSPRLRRVHSEKNFAAWNRWKDSDELNHQFSLITEKLTDLQFEVSRLSTKINEYDQESIWTLRYSRRMVILADVILGWYVFITRFVDTVRQRMSARGFLGRLLVPRPPPNKGKSLSSFLLIGLAEGVQSSTLFFTSALLHTSLHRYKRNLGFLLSVGYSIYLGFFSTYGSNPIGAIYVSLFFNFFYVLCRYYYLNGLAAFRGIHFL
mmetsp:Transcript_2003/g.3647  ORF Transcript_2003/g.3647 Transcript_2003/m.3647 type:complete len:210 (+) Transcript_2003:25-654(+)